jgi:Uma2 family endonuclease
MARDRFSPIREEMSMTRATLDNLYRTPWKAELIGGRIVSFMPTGRRSNRIAARISRSLDDHAVKTGVGEAFTGSIAFAIPNLPSGRESFSPNSSYHKGPFPKDPMRFIEGAPTFAAEVRSDNDYGATAEADMADKRADYFQAGTEVVWDVDTLAECIHVFRSSDPGHPVTFQKGQLADAEPAVPGWHVAVDWIFS